MTYLFSLLSTFDKLTPFNKEAILKALNILWQGLLAIFVVIALIIIAVKAASWIIAKCEDAKKRREAKKAEAEKTQPE